MYLRVSLLAEGGDEFLQGLARSKVGIIVRKFKKVAHMEEGFANLT